MTTEKLAEYHNQFNTGLPQSLKVLELAKENPRPWKVLEFGLRSLKILEWTKFSTSNCKK